MTGPGSSLGAVALTLPQPMWQFIRGGYMAVAPFFVLSGFVLARNYAQTRWNARSLKDYAVGRLARVYPVYALSLIILFPIILADRTPGKAACLWAYGALLQGWLGTMRVQWNTPAWSLSCEMFFYLAFPFLAIMARRPTWRGILAMAGVACVMTRVAEAYGLPDSIKPLVHLSDFLMGIAASSAYGLLLRSPKPVAGKWIYAPAGVIAAGMVAFPHWLPPGLDLNTAMRPFNAAVLVGLGLGGGVVARALSLRPIVYLGKASYSLYILHVPVLWWYCRYAQFSAPLYIAGVIAISCVAYGLIEEPANRYLRRTLGGRRATRL